MLISWTLHVFRPLQVVQPVVLYPYLIHAPAPDSNTRSVLHLRIIIPKLLLVLVKQCRQVHKIIDKHCEDKQENIFRRITDKVYCTKTREQNEVDRKRKYPS